MTELQITLAEAKAQLAEKEQRVAQIRTKIQETTQLAASHSVHIKRNEAQLAEAILDGVGMSEALAETRPDPITPGPVSPAEARRVVAALETALAESLDQVAQARSAVRRASIAEIRSLFSETCQQYDQQAQKLINLWAQTREIGLRIAAATGVDPVPGTWHRLVIPAAIQPKPQPFQPEAGWSAADIASGPAGNAARNQVGFLLKQRGVAE